MEVWVTMGALMKCPSNRRPMSMLVLHYSTQFRISVYVRSSKIYNDFSKHIHTDI